MEQLSFIIARNFTLFRKNRKNVCLCFVAIAIVFGLYVAFLRDFMIQSVRESGLDEFHIKEFTDELMLSGLLIVVNTTTSFGIMQLSIRDLEIGIRRDYLIAPIKRFQMLLGYWFTSIQVSFIYTTIAFSAVYLFCCCRYDMVLSLRNLIQVLVLILISSIVNSELLLCMIVFIKDTTSFSTFGNLYGMLSGFLAGTYLPYQLYPERLKNVLIFYAPTHLTSFMRQLFLSDITKKNPEAKQLYQYLFKIYGVRLNYQDKLCTVMQQFALIGLGFAGMLLFLGIIYKEKD